MYRIVGAVATLDHKVDLTWAAGTRTVADLGPYVRRGGVFAPLADVDVFVGNMRIVDDGFALAWTDAIAFSADGLWYDAFPADRARDLAVARGHDPVISASTGDPCPASGFWVVLEDPGTTVPIMQGERMPPRDGRPVEWRRMAG